MKTIQMELQNCLRNLQVSLECMHGVKCWACCMIREKNPLLFNNTLKKQVDMPLTQKCLQNIIMHMLVL